MTNNQINNIIKYFTTAYPMYLEKNKTALQQLFSGEDIYFLRNEYDVSVKDIHEPSIIKNDDVKEPAVIVSTKENNYYQPKQKVVVLVNNLTSTDAELLGKILGAVKLNLDLVDIIKLDQEPSIDLSQIFTQKSVNQVITFGIDLLSVNLQISLVPYQVIENQNIKFIYSDSLVNIQNDIPKKKALWVALQTMF